jgi:hypothetical protein
MMEQDKIRRAKGDVAHPSPTLRDILEEFYRVVRDSWTDETGKTMAKYPWPQTLDDVIAAILALFESERKRAVREELKFAADELWSLESTHPDNQLIKDARKRILARMPQSSPGEVVAKELNDAER